MELTPLFKQGDFIRFLAPLASGWNGIGIVTHDVYDEDSIVSFVRWEDYDEYLEYLTEDGLYCGTTGICCPNEAVLCDHIVVLPENNNEGVTSR